MKRILATTGLCAAVFLGACSDDSDKGEQDSGAPFGDGSVNMDGSLGEGGAPPDGAPLGDGSAASDAGDATTTPNDASSGNDAGDSGPVATTCDPTTAPDVSGLGLQQVVTGLSNFIYATQAPGSNDWYLVRQTGQILVLPAGAAPGTAPSEFFSLPNGEISLSALGDDERGLLGLAFAPDYATSKLFYVMVTPTGANANRDQVRQYEKTDAGATLKATILNLAASAANHNGGTIKFGPDGMLYVGTGDGGGGCNSSNGRPQVVDNTEPAKFGKILRLDTANAAGMYAAAGNPFPEAPLVWHYGLRNPYRYNFDPANGDLYIGDVGQDSYEEVDFVASGGKGLNFGWAAFEGKTANTCANKPLRASSTHTEPVFVADRRGVGCTGPYCDWKSVIGGAVYRGAAIPKLQGTYLFGDYIGRRMVALKQCGATTSPSVALLKNADPNQPAVANLGDQEFASLTAVVQDAAGEVYFVANESTLYKLVPR